MKALLLKTWDESIFDLDDYDERLENYVPVTLHGYDRDKRFLYSEADGVKYEFKTGYFRKNGLRRLTRRDMAKLPSFLGEEVKPITHIKAEQELKRKRKSKTSYTVVDGSSKYNHKTLLSASRRFNLVRTGYIERCRETGSSISWDILAEKENGDLTMYVNRKGRYECSPRNFKGQPCNHTASNQSISTLKAGNKNGKNDFCS